MTTTRIPMIEPVLDSRGGGVAIAVGTGAPHPGSAGGGIAPERGWPDGGGEGGASVGGRVTGGAGAGGTSEGVSRSMGSLRPGSVPPGSFVLMTCPSRSGRRPEDGTGEGSRQASRRTPKRHADLRREPSVRRGFDPHPPALRGHQRPRQREAQARAAGV